MGPGRNNYVSESPLRPSGDVVDVHSNLYNKMLLRLLLHILGEPSSDVTVGFWIGSSPACAIEISFGSLVIIHTRTTRFLSDLVSSYFNNVTDRKPVL